MSSKPSAAIKLGDPLPRGGKFFPVCAEDWIRILWHPSAYNGEEARRLPLCLEHNETAAAELAGFEKALVAQLASRSMADPKLFGRMLTTQDTESRFRVLPEDLHAREFLHQAQGLPGPGESLGCPDATVARAGRPDQPAVQGAS